MQTSEEGIIHKEKDEGAEILGEKRIWTISRFVRVILAQGHANLLCIVPILSDVPEGTDS